MIAQQVVDLLRFNRATICTAESITGGEIASTLVAIPGASEVFSGGVVTYTVHSKIKVLGISDIELGHGVVSKEVALGMAVRARELFASDFALSSTGVAGPGPDQGVPAGTIWLGFASKSASGAVFVQIPPSISDRNAIRAAAVEASLSLVLKAGLFAELHPQT